MSYQSIIDADILQKNLLNDDWRIFDCRFNLMDAEWGRHQYQTGHIPGASYAHLNEDLSSEIIPGTTGRHPLPNEDVFIKKIQQWGLRKQHQIIIYDQKEGMFAARLWWMLHWCGFENVAVLNGGWFAWQTINGEVEAVQAQASGANGSGIADLTCRSEMVVDVDEVLANITAMKFVLMDARTEDRYRGENETIDVKAGHIPGAVSSPFVNNVDKAGCFLTQEALKQYYQNKVSCKAVDNIVVYCGSGVTATHNILAMYHAGLGLAKLYPGSWSEWITVDHRPIATGD